MRASDARSVPSAAGSFVSHGARTLSYEAAAAGLGRLLGGAAELQVGVVLWSVCDVCLSFV